MNCGVVGFITMSINVFDIFGEWWSLFYKGNILLIILHNINYYVIFLNIYLYFYHSITFNNCMIIKFLLWF